MRSMISIDDIYDSVCLLLVSFYRSVRPEFLQLFFTFEKQEKQTPNNASMCHKLYDTSTNIIGMNKKSRSSSY